MAIPNSRDTFIDYCLRRLGAPVIDINVDEEQIQDRVDDALLYYRDYHFDGTERIILQYQLSQQDIDNKYIPINDNIIGISNIFDIGDATQSSNLFNVRYQIHLNDLFDFSSSQYQHYTMAMTHIAQLEEIFVGKQPIRYNRHVNKLHIDMAWDKVQDGQYVIIDCYRILDPSVYTDVWGDRWLHRYATALIKRQWGENLKKFEGMQMPGGLTFNGQKIWEESIEEIRQLEEEMIVSYSLPVSDMIG